MIRKKQNKIKKLLLAPFLDDRQSHKPDVILLTVVGLLLFFGLLFLSSTSSSLAFHQHDQDIYFFVRQQILHGLIPGLIVFYFALRINYQVYQKYFKLFFFASIFLLLMVFIPGLQLEGTSAKSWIQLGNFSLQTSEEETNKLREELAPLIQSHADGPDLWKVAIPIRERAMVSLISEIEGGGSKMSHRQMHYIRNYEAVQPMLRKLKDK